ncbi:tetratricopeptide repeat protein [Spirochaeta lutea]|uniref:tetratricopeptide repeat protein n=1 Tax=Spirochaeta lutea TaxID=1480694 RepID=UPI0009DD3E19|nr:tetratricopeptide repeat protein [Spirochaeta lutea]
MNQRKTPCTTPIPHRFLSRFCIRPPGALGFLLALGALLLLFSSCLTPASSEGERAELAADYYRLGNAFYSEGDYAASTEYLSRAYGLNPEIPGLGLSYALSLLRLGNQSEAEAILTGLVEDDPMQPLYYSALAYSAALQEDFSSAEGYYQALGELREPNPQELFNWILIRVRLGDLESAAALIQGIPEEWLNDQPELLAAAGRVALLRENFDEALDLLKRYQARGGSKPDFLSDLVEVLHFHGLYLEEAGVRATLHRQSYKAEEQAIKLTHLYVTEIEDLSQGFAWIKRAIEAGLAEEVEELFSVFDPTQQAELNRLADAAATLEAAE